MNSRSRYGSKKLLLILTLLIGALSASAITFGDSILAPLGLAREGASFSSSISKPPTGVDAKPLRVGILPGLTSPSLFVVQTAVDDAGADDEPGQKDLNALSVDYANQANGTLDVTWNWDSTSTTGNNTRDACSLFDTDGDGNANYSFCVIVATNGSVTNVLYSCGDDAADKCTQPLAPIANPSSVGTASVVPNSDPFGVAASPNYDPAHVTGNTCATNPACYTADTVAVVDIDLNDFGDPASAILLNVCSYPSGEPNSDPSDCVFEEPHGSLTLVKVVNNFGESGTGYLGVSDFPLSVDANATTSGAPVDVVSGDHTIAETAQTGYTVGTWTCTDGTTGTAGSVSATVNVGPGESVTCTMTNTLIANPAIDLVKTAQTFFSTPPVAGDKITYTFQITNTSNVTLSGVDLDDTLLAYSNVTCGVTTLAPGASTSCTADYFLTQANVDAGSVANTATACGDPPAGAGNEVCDSDGTNTPIAQAPSLSILKTANPTTYDSVGDMITYTIVATNTGNVTLNNVTVSDPGVDGLTCNPANGSSLAPGAAMTCTATHTITQADLDNGSFANTACVDDGAGGAAQVCDDETVTGDQDPELQIVKSANPTTYDSVGDVITYTITVTNTGNVTLNNVTVTDPGVDGLTCNPANGSSLAPDAVMTCTATHTVSQADLDAGSYLNTACADDGAGGAAQVCDDETVTSLPDPRLSIVKTANPTTYNAPGQVITYTIVATNIGNVTLASVTVTDPGVDGLTCNPANGSSLAPGAAMTCTATHTISQGDIDVGSYLNTACADDGAGGAAQVCDPETVTAIRTPALTLEKTSDTQLITAEGQVINYSYVITNTGNVTLTGITLVDDKLGAISCPGTVLLPGGSMTCTASYTVQASDLGLTSLVNVAVADSDQTNPGVDDTVSIPVALPDVGHLFHTGVTCSDFVAGLPGLELESAAYVTKAGKVNNVAPGVMFYYGTITAPSANFTFNLEQSNDAGWKVMPVQGINQIILYSANCGKLNMVTSFDSAGTATINVVGATAGATYIVGIKYSLSGLSGSLVDPPLEIATYSFEANINGTLVGSSGDSISIFPK